MHPALRAYLQTFDKLLTANELEGIGARLEVLCAERGAELLRAEQIARRCYMVLSGCIRQYQLTERGEEITTEFYTEGQAAVLFQSYTQQTAAGHFWVCAEDCVLIAGDLGQETEMYRDFPKLEQLTRTMMAENFGKQQLAFARFIASSPEDRYLQLLETRPELLHRVPQRQIASYLGVTPESLSRIRARLAKKK